MIDPQNSAFFFARLPHTLSGVDGMHYHFIKELQNREIPAAFITLGEDDHKFPDLPSNVIPTPPNWQRALRIRGKSRALFDEECYRQAVAKHFLPQKQNFFFAGHLHYLWQDSPPVHLSQVGVIHAQDDRSFVEHHTKWSHIISVSEQVGESARQALPSLASSIITIPNGVSTQPPVQRKNEGTLRLLFASRLEKENKRAQDIASFVKELDTANIEYHLTIAGEGSLRTFLEKEIYAHTDKTTVSFVGSLDTAQLYRAFQKADIILSFSEKEGTPIALLEAMSFGCLPIISSGNGAVSDLLNNRFPHLAFPTGQIAEAVSLVLKNTKDRANFLTLQQEMPAFVQKHFSAKTMVDRYLTSLSCPA